MACSPTQRDEIAVHPPSAKLARPAQAAAPDPKHLRRALDAVFEPLDRSDAPGLVVGIALHGQPVYRRGFGLASVQHGIANLPTTRMRIASISKHFTSLACLLLVEDGRLDIDAPASRYLPGLPQLQGTPSLRQFMAHTSGYRCTLEMGTLANGLAIQPKDWQIRALMRQSGVNFAPGGGQLYCNGTYHVLSEIIERVAGVSFESFLKTRIFDPLGMSDTECVPDPREMVPGMASLHVLAPSGRWQWAPAESELRGDGGIVSTVDDMLRWLRHLKSPKIVGSENTWRQLLEPVTLANGFRSVYSLGLRRHLYRGVEVIHHSGGLFGLSAQMLTAPGHELDIMIVSNGAPISATELSFKVVDAVLGPDRLSPPRQQPHADSFSHLIGARYRGKAGLALQFDRVGDKLGLSLFNLPPAPVLYEEGDAVRAGFADIGMGPYEFSKDALAAGHGEAPQSIAAWVCGDLEMLERLPASAPPASALAPQIVGRYYSTDLAAQAQIARDGEELLLTLQGDYSGARAFRLSIYSPVELGVAEDGPEGAHFVAQLDRVPSSVRGFWVDTYRARRIRFDRIT